MRNKEAEDLGERGRRGVQGEEKEREWEVCKAGKIKRDDGNTD